MPGDIQLSSAAMIDQDGDNDQYESVGEQPTDPINATPEELQDKPLAREQVESFMFEIMHQPSWRREADKCSDYYDGNQLSEETLATLDERKQPAIISNLIKPTVDTLLGIEAKSRTDWKVMPDDDGSCSDDLAEALSLKLKRAEVESRADRACSDAYAAQLKAGLGWVEVSRETDPFKCPYRIKYVHRREIFWDWRSEQPDLSDAAYLIRKRWLELDHAVAMMQQYATLFRMTANGWSGYDPIVDQSTGLSQSFQVERDTKLSYNDWRDIQRQRICLSEIWYRKWVRAYVLKLPNGRVIEADFNNPKHSMVILGGVAQVSQATFQKVRLAWYAGPHFLYDVPSPYKHNYFPYVPFFGYREDQTNAPYGMIRAMLSPQDEINARRSKAQWILNSRRVITDSDAVEDHDLAAQEIARPDSYIILNAKRNPNSKFMVDAGGELAQQQFLLMQESKQEIAETSGIHKTMMGQQTGAKSGLAINSLAEQGSNSTGEINDNFRFGRRMVGELMFEMLKEDLSNGQQVVSIGNGKNKKVVVLNQQSADPETGEPVVLNDVSAVNAKVVLDDIPTSSSFRLQQLQMITAVASSLPPQVQALLTPFIIESTDMPDRFEVAETIRDALGIQDQDPEQKQAMLMQQQQEMAQQKETQDKMIALAAAEKAAKIRETNAKADYLLTKK
ncbi:MAG: phage portal protein [Gammaproteobacteria bacterium]|nr:MAG: phage portal protein [Gammaproteobacteria bacterium]